MTMLRNRKTVWLAAGVLVLLTGLPAMGQGLRGMQLFAPAEVGPYGSGPQPNEGFFFAFDGLRWSISQPPKTPIGFPNLTRNVYLGPEPTDMVVQQNTFDTGEMEALFTEGNRIELGCIQGHDGWLLSTYRLTHQTQQIVGSGVDMVFFDPEFGPQGTKLLDGIVGTIPDPADPPDGTLDVIRDLPLTFTDVFLSNRVETWGLELMYMRRLHPTHRGGNIELLLGVRYLEFNDLFDVRALGGILDESNWSTNAENHVVGPQVGARWFRQHGRWIFSTEGRFFAGFNAQNVHQRGTLGSSLTDPLVTPRTTGEPLLMTKTNFTHTAFTNEWAPSAELRAELKCQLTRSICVKAGWTGVWMDGVARASNLIHYEVPDMGIDMAENRQDMFMHGWTIGVDVNR